MTDGARLMVATTYALVFDRGDDSIIAARQLPLSRIAELLDRAGFRARGQCALQIDERDFLDEIVSVP